MKLGLREFVFLTVMLALLGCTWWFVFRKANEKRDSMLAEIRQKQSELENLRTTTLGVADMPSKLAEIQKAVAFFESKLPPETEIDKVVEKVSEMAAGNALVCRQIKTLKKKRGPFVSEQPIELQLAGDFSGFYQFLLQLEKLPRITRLTQMNLEKLAEKDGQMQATVVLSIFFEAEAPPVATAK